MAGRRKKKNELGYPPWIMDALAVLRPPEKLTVSEWADKFRVLSELDSAAPGQWHTAKTPYLRAVMDAFNDDFIHEITFCAGTQLGKTAAEQNMIGYAVAQDPAPMLVVYPSEKLAKFTSEKRLQPMIKLSPALADKFDERGSKDLELSLGGMYIALVGANSPSELSSRPVRYIFFDEIDKFPKWTGAEAGPLELAAERTKTFYNRKIVKVSTPTLKTGNIWQGWETADIQYRYYVPCPHCGEMQTLEFRQIKWMDGADEIDMVINVGALKDRDYSVVLEDIKAVKEACGEHILKVIIETCLLTDDEKVKACELAKEAGADFVKTSTGFSSAGAKVEDVRLMRETVGPDMGVKASGGIHDKEFAKELVDAGANRLGTSATIEIVESAFYDMG